MNSLLKTILILLFTVIVLPIITFYYDSGLSLVQIETLKELSILALIVALLCFFVSQLTGNCSQVDKLWSILPIIYTWYMAYKGGFTPILILMASLVSIWGGRLTYNFSRRGAYKLKFWEGEEDYRWAILRETPLLKGKISWMLFNLFFISLYQNALILAFTLPMLVSIQATTITIGFPQIIISILILLFIVIETIADQQQWTFQNKKHQLIANKQDLNGDFASGFIKSGLWKIVRHPNYASEQMIWILFYTFSIFSSNQIINWSIAGSLLLLILFQGSSDFSEGISSKKYPEYELYKKTTGRFIPKLFK